MDNSTQNKSLELDYCENGIPSIVEFFDYFEGTKWFVVILPAMFCSFILWIYCKNLKNLIKVAPKNTKSNCISLLSIYPIVSVCSLTAICVPRAYFFIDTIGHVSFMIISYQLYRLIMIYVDGESHFIAIANKEAFTFKSPPLCCCCPLGRFEISKKKFLWLRFLILQMPLAHIVIFLVLNIIFIENIDTFDNVILYFIPFIALTVLGGIWGFNLIVRMISPQYQNLKLVQKYFSFQLVLFFCKIQPIFLNMLMKYFMTSCQGPFTIVVKRHIVIQIIIQLEMTILSIWASMLYKNPSPGKL